MPDDLLASGLHTLPVAIEPRFQILVAFREPSGLAPYVCCMRRHRHWGDATRRATRESRLAAPIQSGPTHAGATDSGVEEVVWRRVSR
jgi:hypothetical protein